ncbi:MAG: hypothetical protein K9G33_02030 [Sneathiella sp.]|nr:hypothetical protein [Sneathiella sp.]
MRHNTRSALLNIGFGDVVACAEINDFLECANTGEFDLILAETGTPDANILEIVRRIRRHRIGSNPFVNVVLSLWNAAPEAVSDGINSGADDLISRPMSRTQIFERILRLVQARKPFVVTTDYIGPDRRLISRSYPVGSSLVVPNSLQAKVESKPELLATPEAINLAMKAVNERKISIYTEQLIRLSSAVLLLSGFDKVEDREGVISAMRAINKRLAGRVEETALGHLSSLCGGLNDLLDNIGQSKESLKDRERELLMQIPLAIHKGCLEVHNSAALVFDIRDISAQLREKKSRIEFSHQERDFVPGNL